MKNFLRSNTFSLILSIVIAIIMWAYVAYVERPVHEIWVEDVPVTTVNVSRYFEDGSISIIGENSGLINGKITTDIKIKGKRNIISSIGKKDISCIVDMITVDKSGIYRLTPSVETQYPGIEIIQMRPSKFGFSVEDISQRDIDIELKTKGELPSGYTIEELENKNKSVKVTGPESSIDLIKTARITLDLSTLDTKSSEKSIKIEFLDSRLEPIDSSQFAKSVEYAKVSYKLYTVKEADIILTPRYKNDIKKNSVGQSVRLSADSKQNVTSDGGQKMKVKLKGTISALEKYLESETVVYTQEINVSSIYSDKVFENIEAAPLSDDIEFVSVPKINVKATVSKK